jgi:hypothetical protein
MFDPKTTQGLTAALMDLQDTWAHQLGWDAFDHEVLLQISVSNAAGQVFQTIRPAQATHSNSVPSASYVGRGFGSMDDGCRLAALAAIAKVCFYEAADPGAVITATMQDKRNSFGQGAVDHTVVVSLQGGTVVADHREFTV